MGRGVSSQGTLNFGRGCYESNYRGLSVRECSPKKRSFSEKTKYRELDKFWPLFQAKYKFGHIFDKNFEKFENFDEMLSKKGVIWWEIVNKWCWLIQKGGYWVWAKQERGSMGESWKQVITSQTQEKKNGHSGQVASLDPWFWVTSLPTINFYSTPP